MGTDSKSKKPMKMTSPPPFQEGSYGHHQLCPPTATTYWREELKCVLPPMGCLAGENWSMRLEQLQLIWQRRVGAILHHLSAHLVPLGEHFLCDTIGLFAGHLLVYLEQCSSGRSFLCTLYNPLLCQARRQPA